MVATREVGSLLARLLASTVASVLLASTTEARWVQPRIDSCAPGSSRLMCLQMNGQLGLWTAVRGRQHKEKRQVPRSKIRMGGSGKADRTRGSMDMAVLTFVLTGLGVAGRLFIGA